MYAGLTDCVVVTSRLELNVQNRLVNPSMPDTASHLDNRAYQGPSRSRLTLANRDIADKSGLLRNKTISHLQSLS